MKDIHVKFIPQHEQRFDCVDQIGDYWETEDTIEFRITRFKNPIYSLAILIHELHEKHRNNQLGIKDADVDQFDLDHPELDEPGESPQAPYHRTHMEADCIERLYIILAGGDWVEYEKAVEDMLANRSK